MRSTMTVFFQGVGLVIPVLRAFGVMLSPRSWTESTDRVNTRCPSPADARSRCLDTMPLANAVARNFAPSDRPANPLR